MKIPSKKELNDIVKYFRYNKKLGMLFWRLDKGKKTKKGDVSGSYSKGYIQVRLNKKRYFSHRIIWFLHYREWPLLSIDHINGDGTDNRITNIRQVTPSENTQNSKCHREGRPIGVNFFKRDKKWRAFAPRNFLKRRNSKTKYLGIFDTMEEATKAVIDFCTKGEK